MIDSLSSVIQRYNLMRSPEATAELVEVSGNEVKVRFRGPFVCTCGVIDWMEDLAYFAEDFGLELTLKEVEDLGPDEKLAVFELKRKESA